MDKKGNIKEHSKEKLSVYKSYLVEYLSVLTNQPHYDNIFIWDIFAGKGKDENGNEGSALIAAEAIKNCKNEKQKNIQLILNELDEENNRKLNQEIKPKYENFTKIYNQKAEDFLKAVVDLHGNKNSKIINFFFIDPHGYTQYSPETLKKLLKLKHSEYLIFIPTNHIYRFQDAEGLENNRAKKFLIDLGIEENLLKDIKNELKLIEELEKIFKKISNSNYVYSYKLENKEKIKSFYHLFFITKHIYGAEKFLTAKNKVKESLKTKQLELFDIENKEERIKDFLKDGFKNNIEIYEWRIINALLPKEINSILKELENKDLLEFDRNRRRGSFYISYKYYSKKIKKLSIKLK